MFELRTLRRFVLIAAAAAYWLFLFAATHTPGKPDDRPPRLPHLDKVQHVLAFAVLGALVAAAASSFRAPSWRTYAAVVGAIAAYALFDEWTQGLVERRMSDALDWFADVAGGALGVAAFAAADNAWRRRSEARPTDAEPSPDSSRGNRHRTS